MSWFDASGLANIAKSALKEAQRTIDKALDIKEADNNSVTVPANTPVDTNSDDFFNTWGIAQSGNIKTTTRKDVDETIKTNNLRQSATLWGSFTGSFFETPSSSTTTSSTNKDVAKSVSVDSLDDSVDISNENFNSSKLVVQHSDDGDGHSSRLSSNETDEDTIVEQYDDDDDDDNDDSGRRKLVEICLDSPDSVLSSELSKKSHDKPSNLQNRVSVISNESGKNSSESVELVSTECTSPGSDLLSSEYSTSISSCNNNNNQKSESVEILADSLTSPSSVEIIDELSPKNEFLSPMTSPLEDEVASPSIEKVSPDSVEVIAEDQEQSIGEDTMSYQSISESVSGTTVLDTPFSHLKQQKLHSIMTENDASVVRAPNRSNMHLPITNQNNQILIDQQPQSVRQEIPNFLKNTNIIDIPNDEIITTSVESVDDGSQSDRTIIGKDGGMDSSSDTSLTDTGVNSMYLKNMLADAMTEKLPELSTATITTSETQPDQQHFMDLTQSMIDPTQKNCENLANISITQLEMPPRELSPLSSESRSDLVKIGSDHTSGHTSCDDLETTTSSDIEIISSPNGDSSSTQSRHSPAKNLYAKHSNITSNSSNSSTNNNNNNNTKHDLHKITIKKAKGHNRELSEASSISDDSHSSEVDRLIKKITEMTEILDSRESKLIDMNRRNIELQELNTDLKHQLDLLLTKQLESIDLTQITDEYTQRLSALEKRFQQAIREKDTLRKLLEQSKQDAATRMSKTELDSMITEKNEIIKELREEGEKLSKQQLQHSNIIKKLRAKEKENEATIKNLKETVENLSSENERLKRSLTAKEDVERSQIEAVDKLTVKNRKYENEIAKLQSKIDDMTQKYDTVKKSLDAAKKELIDQNKTSSELMAREHKLESLENEKRLTESQNVAIINQLEDLRLKLRQHELDYVKKEQQLRKENSDLLQRLEHAEVRNEELSQSVLEISKPLVRQLESLQATHTMKVANFEKLEQELTLKINELQGKLQAVTNSEKLTREECVGWKSRITHLENDLNKFKHQYELLQVQFEQERTQKQIFEQDSKRDIDELMEKLKLKENKIDELTKDITTLQEQLNLERNLRETEMKKTAPESSQLISRNSPQSRSNSPTLSLGKASIPESLTGSFWSQHEDGFDAAQMPRYTNMFEIQMLQTNLKQRDGEAQQLQWELDRREQERTLLNIEITKLLTKIDELESKANEFDDLKKQFDEIQQQYDTLCQLYGEKVEENEELKLDLLDVKEVYKSQIDELLRQQQQQQLNS